MLVAIIDYGSGNLHSARKAFEVAAAASNDSPTIKVTSDPETVRSADRIVLPGVGAFADCKMGLAYIPGMIETLQERVVDQGRPFLGICVGMQLLATEGHEHQVTNGLNWVRGVVDPIRPSDQSLKVPHMGWNTLELRQSHPLFKDIPVGADGLHAYFVHSYQLRTIDPSHVLATTDYSVPLTAVVGRDNIVGTQFHPEKSQKLGLAVIKNFLEWNP